MGQGIEEFLLIVFASSLRSFHPLSTSSDSRDVDFASNVNAFIPVPCQIQAGLKASQRSRSVVLKTTIAKSLILEIFIHSS